MREFWPAPLQLAFELDPFDCSIQPPGFDFRVEQGQPGFGSETIFLFDVHPPIIPYCLFFPQKMPIPLQAAEGTWIPPSPCVFSGGVLLGSSILQVNPVADFNGHAAMVAGCPFLKCRTDIRRLSPDVRV